MAGFEMQVQLRGADALRARLAQMTGSTQAELAAGITEALDTARARVVAATPRSDQGGHEHAQDSWQVEPQGPLSGRLFSDDPVIGYLLHGTSAHGVDPVNATMLRFEIGGRVVFARHVEIPAHGAHMPLVDAVAAINEDSRGIMQRAAQRIAALFGRG